MALDAKKIGSLEAQYRWGTQSVLSLILWRRTKPAVDCRFGHSLWAEYCDTRNARVGGQGSFLFGGEGRRAVYRRPTVTKRVYLSILIWLSCFNQVLKKPLKIYLADEEAVKYLIWRIPLYRTGRGGLQGLPLWRRSCELCPEAFSHKKKNLLTSSRGEYEVAGSEVFRFVWKNRRYGTLVGGTTTGRREETEKPGMPNQGIHEGFTKLLYHWPLYRHIHRQRGESCCLHRQHVPTRKWPAFPTKGVINVPGYQVINQELPVWIPRAD